MKRVAGLPYTDNEKALLDNAFSSNSSWREKEFDAMIHRVQTDVMNTVDKHRAQQQYSANLSTYLSRQQQVHLPSIPGMKQSKSMPLPTYQTNNKFHADDYQTDTM